MVGDDGVQECGVLWDTNAQEALGHAPAVTPVSLTSPVHRQGLSHRLTSQPHGPLLRLLQSRPSVPSRQ